MSQIGAALVYYKLGQTWSQIGAASLLQIGASVLTDWSSYYKLGQLLLQNRAGITNWGNICCKLGQVLQIRAIIRNWGVTTAGKLLFESFTIFQSAVETRVLKCGHLMLPRAFPDKDATNIGFTDETVFQCDYELRFVKILL